MCVLSASGLCWFFWGVSLLYDMWWLLLTPAWYTAIVWGASSLTPPFVGTVSVAWTTHAAILGVCVVAGIALCLRPLQHFDGVLQQRCRQGKSPGLEPLHDVLHVEVSQELPPTVIRALRCVNDYGMIALVALTVLVDWQALTWFMPLWLVLMMVRTVCIMSTWLPASSTRFREPDDLSGLIGISTMRHDMMFSGHAMAITLLVWGWVHVLTSFAWWWRALVAGWGGWMCLSLVISGEHYTVDVVVGVALTLMASAWYTVWLSGTSGCDSIE